MGSVVTELLRVEEGICIVRAQILVNSVVLGTGLAGSSTVESAEDAALARALAHAGFNLSAPPSKGEPRISYSPPPSGNGIKPIETDPLSWNVPSLDPRPAPPPFPEPLAQTSNALNTPEDPEDLSDIIAKTDVELKRIGWTPKEGREFLESQFQKKSRHQLNARELREFLSYLKQQSPKSRQEAPF